MDSLINFIEKNNIMILCITESHLTSAVASSFVKVPHFNLIRSDVKGHVHKHGVCAFIQEDLVIDKVSCPMANVLLFRLAKYDVYFLVVYRPPSYSAAENEKLECVLQEVISGKEMIILGDFNLPNIEWTSQKIPSNPIPPLDSRFLDVFTSCGLVQWVLVPTFPSSGNTLDLLLTTEKDRVGNVDIVEPLPACDHCPVIFEYVFEGDHVDNAAAGQENFVWHRGNYLRLNALFSEVDWSFEFTHLNACSSFDKFASIVQTSIKECIPRKKVQAQVKPPWRTNPPPSLIRTKQEAWAKYKRARLCSGRKSSAAMEAFTSFAAINKDLRCFEVKSRAQYENGLIDRFKENPKLLHSYISSKKSNPSSVGPLKLPSGKLCSDPLAMAECLASSFSSVFCKVAPTCQEPHQVHDGHINPVNVSVEGVEARLLSLDSSTAMGPDGIHPLVLKNCAKQLARPLSVIFQRSLSEGLVPKAWKRSVVIPIFKKGHRFVPLNYRPVSLTPICCKTLEHLIADHLMDYLSEHNILTHHQFGFRRGRSTVEQLLLVYEEIYRVVDSGKTMDLILFDYSKAFDKVCHKILLDKLKSIGIDGKLLNWIASFLEGRKMQVAVKGQLSNCRPVESGVPQGSVLGPLLFLIYINHIGSNLSSSYKIFADDLKLYACVNPSMSDARPGAAQSMQTDIGTLHRTSESWGLTINRDKCAVLRFARNSRGQAPPEYFLDGSPLPTCKTHGDLGVLVDDKLKFHEHVSSVAHKAFGLCQSFLKSTVCRTPEFMMFLLTTHVRPLIEYASCLWNTGYKEDLRKLERVQRMWTRHIKGLEGLSYEERLSELNLYSVQGRLLRADLIQFWKIFHDLSCIKPEDMFTQPPHSGTRGHRFKIHVTRAVSDVRKRCFSHRSVALWNGLPDDVVAAGSLTTFKAALSRTIHDDLYKFAE